jgi:hypothetical protein
MVEPEGTQKIPDPACPVCGTLPNSSHVRENRGVMLADYCCPRGHLFHMKWLVAS